MALRRRLFLLSLAVAVGAALTLAPAGFAATACSGDGGQPAPENVGSGWTLRVCLTVPDNNGSGTLEGNFPRIVANPQFTGGSNPRPRIQRMEFTLTGQGDAPDHDLFTDFTLDANGNSTFIFPRHAYRGGVGLRFAVRAMMTGASSDTGALAFVDLSFAGSRQPLDSSFRVINDGGRAPTAGRPYVVAVTGDAAGGEPSSTRVLRMIRSWNPNLFLNTGDVYNNGTQAEFYNHYGLGNRLWGTLRGRTIPTIGNHESFYKPEGQDGFGYFNYWFQNDDSASSHHFSNPAYRGWHIVSLDSTRAYLTNDGGNTAANNQLAFIRNDLVGNARTGCALALYHHPRYSRGPEEFNGADVDRLHPIWQTLASRGVDVVLNGHDHNYQRSKRLNASGTAARNGTVEFVVGSGGHGIEPTDRRDSRIVRKVDREGQFGALRLVLNRHGAEYRFQTVGGRVHDRGVLPCSGRRADQLDNTRPTRPRNLRASKNGRRVTLRWYASSDVEGVGVTRYRIFRNGNYIGTTRAQSFTNRAPQGLNRYYVRAVDYSRNVSFRSNIDRVRIP